LLIVRQTIVRNLLSEEVHSDCTAFHRYRRPSAASPKPRGLTRAEVDRGRPRLIAIKNSTNVRVAGLRVNNQASWCPWVLSSQNIEMDGVTITAAHNGAAGRSRGSQVVFRLAAIVDLDLLVFLDETGRRRV
jgi:polygalacturonase